MKFDLALVSPPLKTIMGKYLRSAQGPIGDLMACALFISAAFVPLASPMPMGHNRC
ncbi:hypothetical protein [uncultured Pelagibacterium sp.]|uniref:hypothetical protein n=1 Tax=uncultured Pelagibacterium sp. TaxID=1159875 RepID=UPI0030DA34D5